MAATKLSTIQINGVVTSTGSSDAGKPVITNASGKIASANLDLTTVSTDIGTTTPPGVTVSTIFRSANSGNVSFIAQPFGTGAFQLQQTDSTATGGNARGANAVDLQTVRSAATQVASGAQSFVQGSNNTASGIASAAIGDSNTSSGSYSSTWGLANTASSTFGIAMGAQANNKGVYSLICFGGTPIVASSGKNQLNILNLGVQTTTNTPTVIKSSTAVATSTNQLVLQNNSAMAFWGLAIAAITGAGDTSAWVVQGAIKRGANAASTVLVGTPTVTLIGQNAGASGWTLALTASTTDGCLAATVTNGSGVTVRVNLSLFASEVTF